MKHDTKNNTEKETGFLKYSLFSKLEKQQFRLAVFVAKSKNAFEVI